jgi:hypothetical protein
MLRKVEDLTMETVSSSETWVNIYQTTRRSIPDDCHLHSRRRENPKDTSKFPGFNLFPQTYFFYLFAVFFSPSSQVL